tara:strand:- start:39 stop:626 length:588 start_codon:yes stop_codon:yes gene_type:complete
MRKPIIIQTLILSLILIILFSSYRFFLYEKEDDEVKILNKTNGNNDIEEKGSNLIEDLNYNASDKNGNNYEIFSKTGVIDEEDPNILYLKNVKAIIKIRNSGIVNIYSDFAKYNKSNLNTHFYENVGLKFKDHNITSNNIYLDYIEKKIKVADNVNYYDKDNKMTADIIEFDLLTKVSRVYMLDQDNKIKGLIKN